MSDRHERSEAEREAARVERERRRARKEGRPYPDPPRASEPPPRVSEPPPRVSEPPARASEPPAPGDDGPPPMRFIAEPPRFEPRELETGEGPATEAHELEPFDLPAEEPDPTGEHEAPSGTRRAFMPRRPYSPQDPAPAGVPRPRQRRQLPHPHLHRRGRDGERGPARFSGPSTRRHSLRARIAGGAALIVAIAFLWFLYSLFQPFHGDGSGRVVVTIPAHSGAGQVGDILARDGVIDSSFFFGLRVALAGDRSELRAGTFTMKRGMSYGAALTQLTAVPPPVKTSMLTVTEGRTRRQLDALLRSQGIKGSYMAASRRSPLLNPVSYGAPARLDSLEGFLFPSTYELRDPISVTGLVNAQLTQFKRVFAGINLAYASSKHLSAYDVLNIASMVQAEAFTQHDRPLIASVIYNRLRLHMPLQIDATTRYATNNYTQPLTQSELNSPSPYNTRIHPGLPPTPIDNPGLPSLQAAAHPANTNFLYFVVKPCGNGEQVFTASYQQFLQDAARYQQARARRGGRSPANC